MENLNKEQIEAVHHTHGPLLIVAGAGTGKTHVISQKIHYLITKLLLSPSEILVLTFSRKACYELQERVALTLLTNAPLIHTFHSYGQSFIQRYPLATSMTGKIRILSTEQEETWAIEYAFEWLPKSLQAFANIKEVIPFVLSFYNQMVDYNVSHEAFHRFLNNEKKDIDNQTHQFYLALYPLLLEALLSYKLLKKRYNILSFSDLLSIPLDCMHSYQDVHDLEQAQYKYILVDEFQDTNITQFALLQMLTKQHTNICVCGDDDQAIYGFRGATVQNIINFRNIYPDFKKVVLIKNYRSAQPILDTSYRLIQHNNPHRLEHILQIDKKLQSQMICSITESNILFNKFSTLSEEEMFIIEKIQNLNKNGIHLDQIAILVRKHTQIASITNFLQKSGIPYKAKQKISEYFPIRSLLLMFLECCVDFTNDSALSNIAGSFLYTISGRTLFYLLRLAKLEHTSLYVLFLHISKNSQVAPQEKKKIQKIMKDLKVYQQLAIEQNTGTVLLQLIHEKHIFEKLLLESKENEIFEIQNLFKTIEIFIEQTGLQRIDSFLYYLHKNNENSDDDNGQDAVHVSTIHHVKGKEYSFVFLPYLTQGSLPAVEMPTELSVPNDLKPEQSSLNYLFEERRLLYVGLTRAKEQVLLSWTENYSSIPSQFIQECK